jgi:hypothetical protein
LDLLNDRFNDIELIAQLANQNCFPANNHNLGILVEGSDTESRLLVRHATSALKFNPFNITSIPTPAPARYRVLLPAA